jgi:hypothetical protein
MFGAESQVRVRGPMRLMIGNPADNHKDHKHDPPTHLRRDAASADRNHTG